MARLEIVKFGNKRGIGSIVKQTGFFGSSKTWTLVHDNSVGDDYWGLDIWVCRETGESHFREFTVIDKFYSAQFNTREAV